MYIDVDEEKNKSLIRRTAENIRLKQFYNRNVSYKEIEERINNSIIELMSLFLLVGTLMICYILTLTYISLINKTDVISINELNTLITFIIILTTGIEFGLAINYDIIRKYMKQDYRKMYDLQTISENK